MTILALDTTSRHGSLALAEDGKVVEIVTMEAPKGFAPILFPEICGLLERHGLETSSIDCYAAASGPGSFTGIRVGLTAVKSLAEVHGKPIVAVSNLMALAAAGEGRYRAPLLDARRGEIFAAVYDEDLRPVIAEAAAPWAKFLASLAGREVTFVVQDPGIFEPGGAAEWEGPSGGLRRVVAGEPLAAAVARVAAARFARGQAVSAEAVDANYVRRSDAELKWRDPA